MNNVIKQSGFTYIDVMCATVILLIGVLALVSALSLNILRGRESEQQNMARQIAGSTIEAMFAARDLNSQNGISSWRSINTTDVNPNGIFVPNWNPVREESGTDGIQGTADDTCGYAANCQGNSSPFINGFERRVLITDVLEAGSTIVRKRRVEVSVRYFVGQLQRRETLATMIADLPFNN